MSDLNTNLENHWAIDSPYTENKERDSYDDIITSALDSEKEKLTSSLSKIEGTEIMEVEDSENHKVADFNLDSNLFTKHPLTNLRNYFSQAQKWFGHILEIKDDVFTAKLEDLNSPGTFEMGEFEMREVPLGDKELIKIGAAFYWSVGYAVTNGTVEKRSVIRFQRLSDWSESDYDEAADRADKLFKKLKWD